MSTINLIAKDALLTALKAQFIVPGHCGMVTTHTTLPEMIQHLTAPKGIEHCTAHNLPTLDILTALKPEAPSYCYIEEPAVTLTNPPKVVLIGHSTTAHITLTETNTTQIVLLHGATATITLHDHATAKVDRASDTHLTILHKDEDAFIYDNFCH